MLTTQWEYIIVKIDIKIKDQKALQALNFLARLDDDLSPVMQSIA